MGSGAKEADTVVKLSNGDLESWHTVRSNSRPHPDGLHGARCSARANAVTGAANGTAGRDRST